MRFFATIGDGNHLRRVLKAMLELRPKEMLSFEYGGRWFNVTTNDEHSKRNGVKQRSVANTFGKGGWI